jgi:hypothetical protein
MGRFVPCACISALICCLSLAFHLSAWGLQKAVPTSHSLNAIGNPHEPAEDFAEEQEIDLLLATYQPPSEPRIRKHGAQPPITSPSDLLLRQQLLDTANQLSVDLLNMISELAHELTATQDPTRRAAIRDVQRQLRAISRDVLGIIDEILDSEGGSVALRQVHWLESAFSAWADQLFKSLNQAREEAIGLFRGIIGRPPSPQSLPPGSVEGCHQVQTRVGAVEAGAAGVAGVVWH